MAIKTFKAITILAVSIWLQPPVSQGYEPTYHEILIQKERLESFCGLRDNQRKFDICKRFESLKGKLPKRISEIDAFRRVHERPKK